MKVSVIIPTKDEEDAIAYVIKRVPKKYEVIVVDKSKDRTAEIARKHGARVIKQKRGGKGVAMRIGARKATGDVIAFTDGDGTYPIEKIPEMVKLIEQNKADAVTGSRFLGKIKKMSLKHRVGNWLFTKIASLLYEKTTDVCTGLIVMKRKDFLNLHLKSDGFDIETECFIKRRKKGLKTVEIPIYYDARIGEAKLSSFRDGFKILKMLILEKISD